MTFKERPHWVADRMRDAGLSASVMDTPGHPVVLGEWRGAGPEAPTLLVYGHYDVQPPEPLEEWESPAFEPTVRDGNLFARGASDDKGQLFLHIKALEAQLKGAGGLPVNVVMVAEGEEEIGSPNLVPFVKTHRERLSMRCGRHLRFLHVRPGSSLPSLLPPGSGLFRDSRSGARRGPPFRELRRSRRKPWQRSGQGRRLSQERGRECRHFRVLR